MEFTSSQFATVAQVCEFSTKMGVPATTEGLSGSGVPKDAILCMRTVIRTAYIAEDQLAAARQILCTIYEANRNFFDPSSSYTNEDDMEFPEQQVPESFTISDIADAVELGACAAKAHIEAYIPSGDQSQLVLKPNNSRFTKSLPIRFVHLARQIFEVVCQKNNDFKPRQD